jgi:hypothetical protein
LIDPIPIDGIKKDQSLAGAVREHLIAIERQIDVGVRLRAIHAAMLAQGYQGSFFAFKQGLARARARGRNQGSPSGAGGPPRTVGAPAPEPGLPEGAAIEAVSALQRRDYFARRPIFSKPTTE